MLKCNAYFKLCTLLGYLYYRTLRSFDRCPKQLTIYVYLFVSLCLSMLHRALLQADVVLLLGARLNWIMHFGLPPRFDPDVKVIQVCEKI